MENFPSLEGVSSGKNQQNTRKKPQMAMKIHQIFPFVVKAGFNLTHLAG